MNVTNVQAVLLGSARLGSLGATVILTELTSLSSHHTSSTWTPQRCSWTCTRYSPSTHHRRRALVAVLAFRQKTKTKQNQKNIVWTAHFHWRRKRVMKTRHWGIFFLLRVRSLWFRELSVYTGSCPVFKQKPAAMNGSVRELHPLSELSVIKWPDQVFIQKY